MMDLWLPPKPAIIRPAEPELIRPKGLVQASFLPGWFPGGAAAARSPASLSFIGFTEDTVDRTTYTFTNHAIGVADPTRRVVVVVYWGDAVGRTLSSVSIGGNAATIHDNITGGGINARIAIASLLVAAGTTATIAFTLSGASQRGAVAVYRAINETVATPHANANDIAVTAKALSATIDIPSPSGWVVAGSLCGAQTTPAGETWAGVTEQFGGVWGDAAGLGRTGGHDTGIGAQIGRTVSCTYVTASGPTTGALVAMSWG